MDNVKTVVSNDTGTTNNVHPNDKGPIADRAVAYIEDFINNTQSNVLIIWNAVAINLFFISRIHTALFQPMMEVCRWALNLKMMTEYTKMLHRQLTAIL